MNTVDALFGGQGNVAIGQIAKQFGIDDTQVRDVIGHLAPVLGQGLASARLTSLLPRM